MLRLRVLSVLHLFLGLLIFLGFMNWNRTVQSQSTSYYFSDFRFYDPKVGKFTQADSVVPVPGSLGLNRYAYAYNNPIKYSDPDGHVPRVTQGSDDENVFEKIFFDLVDMVADTADYIIQSNPLAEASQARQTLNDPNASDFDKFKAVATSALGAVSPGGKKGTPKRKSGFQPGNTAHEKSHYSRRKLPELRSDARAPQVQKALRDYFGNMLQKSSALDFLAKTGFIPEGSLVRVKFIRPPEIGPAYVGHVAYVRTPPNPKVTSIYDYPMGYDQTINFRSNGDILSLTPPRSNHNPKKRNSQGKVYDPTKRYYSWNVSDYDMEYRVVSEPVIKNGKPLIDKGTGEPFREVRLKPTENSRRIYFGRRDSDSR